MTGQEILQKNARFAENLRRQAEKIDLGQLEELARFAASVGKPLSSDDGQSAAAAGDGIGGQRGAGTL